MKMMQSHVFLYAFDFHLACGQSAGSEGFTMLQVPSTQIHNTRPCGVVEDCPLSYDLADVRMYDATKSFVPGALELQHEKIRAECQTVEIGSNGGWCYEKSQCRPRKQHRVVGWVWEQGKGGYVDEDSVVEYDKDFLLPFYHADADRVIIETLSKHVLLKQDGSCCQSLSDFGAGVGQIGHALRVYDPDMQYNGYDGAGNVEEFTDNYVKFADLTMPLAFNRTDWVISSEVGEHIPNEFEEQVISNLHAHNCNGIILTWAILGQGGHGHINCHSNKYLIDIFTHLGYNYDEWSELVRIPRTHHHKWYEGSAMVFTRKETPAECKR